MEEDAPVTAATGALGPVVTKLSTLLRRGGEYQLRWQTREDVKLIRSKLKSIHSILWVIWEREDGDAASKELRMEAWRLADDMNDAIDDFILTMIIKRSNGDGKRFIQAKIQRSPFQDLRRRAVDVSERCRNKWKIETAQTTISSLFSRTKSTVDSDPAKRHRVVDHYVHNDVSKLLFEAMRGPRDMLVQYLVGEEESTPQLKMASIHGADGVAKSTTEGYSRLIFEATKDKFRARAFVSFTSCPKMTQALASILQQIAGLSLADTKEATEKGLIDTISNFLEDKRYLVIVDDIQHYGEWQTIKKSLPDNNLGSRIVTTSYVESVTKKWHDDFDALVINISFDRKHPIVKMCHGMPLAEGCVILALEKERERQKQQELHVETRDVLLDRIEGQVKGNGIQNTPGFEPLVESLELGYKDLPHHMLKTCLLYCSIYPEGHKIRRDELVRRWIAQGFVHKEEVGKDYLEELVGRGLLFQEAKQSNVSYMYKLHPMMRNYLRQKLREDNFITFSSDGVPSYPVGRLCIDAEPLSGIDWHHIQSLVVLEDAEKVPYERLQHLRVLDVQCNPILKNQHLKDMCRLLRLRHLFVSVVSEAEITDSQKKTKGAITEIPAEIARLLCRLLRLRHLFVSVDLPNGAITDSQKKTEGAITEIPAEIARLQYLETLDVRRTEITRLPAEIGELKQLKTLDVSWNDELTELPREIWNLQHLEILRIRGSNKLKTLDVSRNPELSGIPRDIGELQHLKNLDITGTGITELPKAIGKLQHLETLDVSGTGITELPREIGNLQHLHALYLNNLKTIIKLPRDIGRLQHLETLHLRGSKVRKITREIGGLKNLKYLDLDTLPFEVGKLSKLKGLPECLHKAWKNSDLVSSLAGEILSFETTHLFGGDGRLIVGTKHMHIPQWIKEHFNDIGSLDIRICKLEEQDLKILWEMPQLFDLKLRFEGIPRMPIAISSKGFARLVSLTIDSRVPRITFQQGAMPRLLSLEFESQFYHGPPNTDHPIGIKNLVKLRRVRYQCNEWYRDSPCISATIDVIRKEAWEHPNQGIMLRLKVGDQPERVVFQWSELPLIAKIIVKIFGASTYEALYKIIDH